MAQDLSEDEKIYFQNEYQKWRKIQKKFYLHPTKKDIKFTNQSQVMKYILDQRTNTEKPEKEVVAEVIEAVAEVVAEVVANNDESSEGSTCSTKKKRKRQEE